MLEKHIDFAMVKAFLSQLSHAQLVLQVLKILVS